MSRKFMELPHNADDENIYDEDEGLLTHVSSIENHRLLN